MGDVSLKLVVVGDSGVGKTCLLFTFYNGEFPGPDDRMLIFAKYGAYFRKFKLNSRTVSLRLFDTAVPEDYERLRPLAYPETDVFLLCFSVHSEASFHNIRSKYIPEVRRYCPDIPIVVVGCKSDLRGTSPAECIPLDRIEEEAKDLGLTYIETSALLQDRVEYCFKFSASLGLDCRDIRAKIKRSRKLFRKKKLVPVTPALLHAGSAPAIEIETSVFGDQWKAVAEAPKYADVIFVTASGHRYKAHKIVLCSSSKLFCGIFLKNIDTQIDISKDGISSLSREEICTGRIPGIARISDKEVCDMGVTSTQTVLDLSSDISAEAFSNVLQFLYSGLPNINSDSNPEEINDVLTLARIFQLPYLEKICENIQNVEKTLNPSIGTYLNDKMGERMKELFFNKSALADVIFTVQGTKVYAHKVVLSARCDVMRSMFSDNFMEGSVSEINLPDVSLEPFLAVLEYMYTDHAPIQDGNSISIMIIANQYFLKRLVNLCELHISKEVDRSVVENIKNSEVDVIGLLISSQLHNADQLERWCLHFIASNYLAFVERKEFSALTGDNLKYVEENRWPPLSYLAAVEEYHEAQMKNYKPKRCSVL